MPIHTRECVACERRYDVLIRGNEVLPMDREGSSVACPDCDGEVFRRAPARFAINKGGVGTMAGPTSYPYFDRGLGCVVKDAGHRSHLMEFNPDGTPRPQKLIPADGIDGNKILAKQRSEQLRIVTNYQNYVNEMNTGENRQIMAEAQRFARETYEKAAAEQVGKVHEIEVEVPECDLEALAKFDATGVAPPLLTEA